MVIYIYIHIHLYVYIYIHTYTSSNRVEFPPGPAPPPGGLGGPAHPVALRAALGLGRLGMLSSIGCANHTHAPSKKSSTNFLLCQFLLRQCSTNRLGHGHGYDLRSLYSPLLRPLTAAKRGWPNTPNPPTKSFPTKSPRVELSGRAAIKSYGHENSHPLELRVCLSRTL